MSCFCGLGFCLVFCCLVCGFGFFCVSFFSGGSCFGPSIDLYFSLSDVCEVERAPASSLRALQSERIN